MAEGYVKVSAIGAHELLGAIATHAQTFGWTLDLLGSMPSPPSGGSTRRCHVSKGGVTANFQTQLRHERHGDPFIAFDAIRVCSSVGFAGASAWDAQPSTSPANTVAVRDEMVAAHLFFYENPSAIFVVIESVQARFSWLAAGILEGVNTALGGQFVGASGATNYSLDGQHLRYCSARLVHGDVDSVGNGWGGTFVSESGELTTLNTISTIPVRVPQTRGSGSFTSGGSSEWTVNWLSDVVDKGYDGATGRLRLFPVRVYAKRKSGGLSLEGAIPGAHYCTLEPFAGGDEVTQDGVTYKVFPVGVRKAPFNPRVQDSLIALQTSAGPITVRVDHHFGIGFALRKPT